MRRFRENSRFYFILVALVVIGITSGCAKKQLPLNPPRVQAVSGDFEGGGPPKGEEVAPPQAGGSIDSASGSSEKSPSEPTDSVAGDIKEETLSEASSSFPKGSFRAGENYLSGGSPGTGSGSESGSSSPKGSFRAGENHLSDGSPGAGSGSKSGSSFPKGSFRGGENYLSGGSPRPGFAPGSSSQSRDLNTAKMIPFKETSDLGDIHFKFDKYELDVLSKKTLAKNAQWLKTHPDVKVEVQGHCDERGTNNYNLGLGERRALNAKKYLMALGVPEDRLFTISYGEEKPFCVESNENCWWQNRRGHFLVSK